VKHFTLVVVICVEAHSLPRLLAQTSWTLLAE